MCVVVVAVVVLILSVVSWLYYIHFRFIIYEHAVDVIVIVIFMR